MLPYYGPVDLMQDAVRSILAQTDPDWHLTVLDDGYPDPAVAQWFGGLGEDRITYLRNETNLGANRNYQRCVELLERDLAVLMGADDIMLPDYVATVRRLHAAYPSAAVIQPGVQVIGGDGRATRTLVDESKQRLYAPRVRGDRELRGEELAVSLLRGNWLYFPALCWRSDAVRQTGFRQGLDTIQDLALVMDLVAAGESLVVSSATCFQYRRHRASDSSWRALAGSRFVEERRFFLDVAERLHALGWSRAAGVARRHVSSRLNALMLLPLAARKRQTEGVRTLGRHVLGTSVPDAAPPPA